MLANVLYAASRAPVTGASRTIYAATAQNVYVYDPGSHSLVVQKAGNWRSDATAAFEVGVACAETIDAGAAMHLAQLEAAALWTGTANQLGSCPRASATTYANDHWDLPEPVDIVISFGIRSVPGLTSTLVAVSSDGSLPDPDVDGSVFMDLAIRNLAYDSTFAGQGPTLVQTSQILWAAYGCSNHYVSGGKAGLTCASAVANYYLSRRIYWVGPEGVYRFHNHLPPGTDATTRDHRIELVRSGDARPDLRQEVSELPDAPAYLILCVGSVSDWPVLEAGFAGMGAVLQASSMGLQGFLTAGLTSEEQAGVRGATSIPAGDIPWVVVSVGQGADASMIAEGEADGGAGALNLAIEHQVVASGETVVVRYGLPADAPVDLTIHDCLGHEVARLVREWQRKGSYTSTWKGQDGNAREVASGLYFLRLRAGAQQTSGQLIILH
jgi:hypothetical protein